MKTEQKEQLENLQSIETLEKLFDNLEMFWNIKFNKKLIEHNKKEVNWNYGIVLTMLQHYFINAIEDQKVCELFLGAIKLYLKEE